ncbi:MAG: ribonuclease Y [Acidobacteria bacterium]|nr:ribonuclease Y [Acidobacteriota bacterium]
MQLLPPAVAAGLAAAVVGLIFFGVWIATRRRIAAETVGRAREEAGRLLESAEREVGARRKEAELTAREQAQNLRHETENHARQRREELAALERDLNERKRTLGERSAGVDRAARDLRAREDAVIAREEAAKAEEARAQEIIEQTQAELQRVSGMTADEAKELLIRQLESDARRDAANLVKRLEHEARETAAEKAKHIITQAIQRSAADHAIETTVSVVDLPSDDLKGRIIGREGRNIRALETATGVELIVDDTPGAIILSSFDPYRREIAKRAIEQLVADGRIHPARIEEVVEKVRAEVDEATLKEGEAAAFELGIHDMHAEINRMMGRLKFRTSYGQNVLAHSKEVAYVAGVMARELGLDAHTTIRAAFVHDVGKAMDRELEGTHLQIGIDFLRKHGETEAVVDAMAAHHMDIDWPSLESMLVQAADAISAARPGARRDILESYVKRLENLEGIADSFKGVSKSFALQAGREIRVMVESERIADEDAVWLSKDIAKRIENELQYPGQIKVTVIRETRSVEYAR